MQCNILQVSLLDPPDFEALSYRWGDLETPFSISIQSTDFEVTENLFTALWYLRDKKQKRILWVDAICIDQTNVSERNHQVQLMRDIYKNARRTLIWLGQDTEEIRQGLAIVPTLLRASQENWTFGECIVEWELAANIDCLWGLLENLYFSRIWVVQEVATSADRLVVCGRLTVSWLDLSLAIGYASRIGIALALSLPSTYNFWSMCSSLLDTATHFDRDLLQLLLRHRSFSATDPRDKVYALLGLSTSTSRRGKHVQIQPDYDPKISVEEVFITTAQRIITTSRNLDIFSVPRATASSRLKGLPSWVPDWTIDEPTSSLLLPERERVNRCYFFATLLESEAELRLKPDGPLAGLGLRGQLIDSVKEVGTLFWRPVAMSASASTHGLPRYFRSLKNFYQRGVMNGLTLLNWERMTGAHCGKLYLTGEHILDVYWQTFLAGSAHSNFPDNWKKERTSFEKAFNGYNYPCYLGLHYSETAYSIAMLILALFSFLYAPLALLGYGIFKRGVKWTVEGGVSLKPVFENRRMFTTENGYIGLGPRDMRVGDHIALFSGGSMPLVMRTKGTKLELVGDCYVHGIMYGERYREDQCELMWII
jgi:hypothetical protein